MSYRFFLQIIKTVVLKTKCEQIIVIQFLLILYDTRFSLRIMKNRVVQDFLQIHKKKRSRYCCDDMNNLYVND